MLDDEYNLFLLNEKIEEMEEIRKDLFYLLPESPEVSEIKSGLDQIKSLIKSIETKLKAKRFN